MNKLDKILENKLEEMHNPNDLAWEPSAEFYKKLHNLKYVDNVFGETSNEVDPENFMEELKRMVHEEDDEIEIEFPDGGNITLDVDVAKHMIANCTQEQIIEACGSSENMHELLRQLFDAIVDPETEEEIENILSDDE